MQDLFLNDGKILSRYIQSRFYKSVPNTLKIIAIKDHENKIYFLATMWQKESVSKLKTVLKWSYMTGWPRC